MKKSVPLIQLRSLAGLEQTIGGLGGCRAMRRAGFAKNLLWDQRTMTAQWASRYRSRAPMVGPWRSAFPCLALILLLGACAGSLRPESSGTGSEGAGSSGTGAEGTGSEGTGAEGSTSASPASRSTTCRLPADAASTRYFLFRSDNGGSFLLVGTDGFVLGPHPCTGLRVDPPDAVTFTQQMDAQRCGAGAVASFSGWNVRLYRGMNGNPIVRGARESSAAVHVLIDATIGGMPGGAQDEHVFALVLPPTTKPIVDCASVTDLGPYDGPMPP